MMMMMMITMKMIVLLMMMMITIIMMMLLMMMMMMIVMMTETITSSTSSIPRPAVKSFAFARAIPVSSYRTCCFLLFTCAWQWFVFIVVEFRAIRGLA